jgi:hypothetical protein
MTWKRESLPQFTASLGLAFCLVISQAADLWGQAAGPPRPRRITLERNQLVELALETPLSSASAKEDQPIAFRLTEPLAVSGETILPAGAAILGRVTEAVPAAKGCKWGKLSWRLEDAVAPDGTRIALRTTSAYRRKDDGQLVEYNPPLSAKRKFARALIWVGLSPLIAVGLALASPWMLLDAVESGDSCKGIGSEMLFRVGSVHYAALRNSVEIRVAPQTGVAPTAPSAATAP